jgi:hypothetical protein
MNMSISFAVSDLSLAPGASGSTQLNIYNAGAAAAFTVQYLDPYGMLAAGTPTSVQIAGLSWGSLPIAVRYPANAAKIIEPTVTATASVSGDSTRLGTAVLTLWRAANQ